MLTNITFTQENGKMRISWRWESSVESVEIRFRKSGMTETAGAPFHSGRILKYPGKGTASAERRMESEWGLYDFTFLPKTAGGEEAAPIVLPCVMVGEKKTIFWEIGQQREEMGIRFAGDTAPPQVACMTYELDGRRYAYTAACEINAGIRLVFPDAELIMHFDIKAKPPYDKAYSFVRSPRQLF